MWFGWRHSADERMDVKLPKLGEGADSGVVVTVFVKEGDPIEKNQPILELESEKAVASVPSPAAGTVGRVYVKPGDTLNIGQPLISVSSGDEPVPGTARERSPEAPPAQSPEPAPPVRPAPSAPADEDASPATREEESGRPAAPPAAAPAIRKLAKELGLDLNRVPGSQRGGRIVMADLKAYIQRLERLAAKATGIGPSTPPVRREVIDFSKWGPVTVKPLSPLRQTISRRMSESWNAVARVTQFDEADVTPLLAWRKTYGAAYEQRGVRLTLTSFLLKALVDTLRQHSVLNASLDADGQNLVVKSYYHISIAVDTDAGLIVPVIRDVDRKNLVEISRDLEEVARKARERKVTADDLKGGTFTLSNQGGIGGAHFTPIINLPEVAILGIGRGAVKPAWRQDHVEPRTFVPLALSYDHRVIDGAAGARFMVDLVQAIEKFDEAKVKLT